MSNTSRITPYIQEAINAVSEGICEACSCAASVVNWLTEETPEDRAAVERLKAERRRERLAGAAVRDIHARITEPVSISSVSLHIRNPESLIRSAEKLGYRVARPAMAAGDSSDMLLTRSSGERLAVQRTPDGNLQVHTAGHSDRVQSLVRQHTLDRAVEHIKSKGMTLQTATLANGEVQILAREKSARKRGGAAELRTQINADGTVWVDVDKVKGSRCEGIVKDLADAVGGAVSWTKRKDSYFQLPGEPARTKVRL